VRRHLENGCELEEAIEQAVKSCVEKDILAEFLKANTLEVFNMLTTEYKMEEAVQVWKEEGFEEGVEKGREEGIEKGIAKGRAEGREEGKEEMARNLLENGISPDLIARSSGLPMERIWALMN
jgi:predicted transposase/invertase (TIGR01784 family)